ncbi:hypothetical protein NAT51_05395 [Flavobacterium amniphilum]|uniref:hypothetical protein n=1 Tax=Flavobacterium amniphilum TaxID=1834035 RepID=UPI002029ECBC|nr:hypothetical protein [Flavobacterium amniphilum]MCL9804941.1 hypothetical protein [Flavobacterium amniphilum]
MKERYTKYIKTFVVLLVLSTSLSSCYSVRIISRDGIPEPDYSNDSQDFYKNKKVTVIDTVIKLGVTNDSFSLIEKCGSSGFYAVEYRTTLGHVLLSGITFGRVRKVKVKYVCLKE